MKEVVRRVTAPHVVPRSDPRRAEVLSTIDTAIGAGMRLLLHHPAFRELEALWRALYFLVRGVETGPRLHISLLDLSRSELAADLDGTAAAGALRRLLQGDALGARPALLVAAWEFGKSDEDLALLGALAELGRQVGAPCLTAGTPDLVGASDSASLAEPEAWEPQAAGWETLRRHADGAWLGVVLPRFLLRLPYGADGEECEGLAFEELSSPPLAHEYVWGNPAIACASLLAQSFSAEGWGMRPGTHREIDDLPLYLARVDAEIMAQPAAEVLLPETATERLLDLGVMPLASIHERGAARLLRFQSIADPPAPLAGRWATA
ncbi:MAG TPA: type VI secretion system contractile sheath large subunit [Vicinamibacteria bacterium]